MAHDDVEPRTCAHGECSHDETATQPQPLASRGTIGVHGTGSTTGDGVGRGTVARVTDRSRGTVRLHANGSFPFLDVPDAFDARGSHEIGGRLHDSA